MLAVVPGAAHRGNSGGASAPERSLPCCGQPLSGALDPGRRPSSIACGGAQTWFEGSALRGGGQGPRRAMRRTSSAEKVAGRGGF